MWIFGGAIQCTCEIYRGFMAAALAFGFFSSESLWVCLVTGNHICFCYVDDIGSSCFSFLFFAVSVHLSFAYLWLEQKQSGFLCGIQESWKIWLLTLLSLFWWGELFLAWKSPVVAEQHWLRRWYDTGKMKLFFSLLCCVFSSFFFVPLFCWSFLSGLQRSSRTVFAPG